MISKGITFGDVFYINFNAWTFTKTSVISLQHKDQGCFISKKKAIKSGLQKEILHVRMLLAKLFKRFQKA